MSSGPWEKVLLYSSCAPPPPPTWAPSPCSSCEGETFVFLPGSCGPTLQPASLCCPCKVSPFSPYSRPGSHTTSYMKLSQIAIRELSFLFLHSVTAFPGSQMVTYFACFFCEPTDNLKTMYPPHLPAPHPRGPGTELHL